jgi:pimeloyl-ACP methyl ester carboxylesterase
VKALGYTDGYDLYGTSYGTRLAQYAMREDPEAVRSVILDGVGGPQIPNAMWSQTKSVSPYVEIFAMCQADAACAEAYPNLAERFDTLLTNLEKEPLVFDPPLKVWAPLTVALPTELTQIDVDFFLGLARINDFAQGGGFVSIVPRMITAAEERDVEYFRSSRLAETGDDAPAVEPVAPTGGQGRPPLVAADEPIFEAPFAALLTLAQDAAARGDTSPDSQCLMIVLADLAGRLEAGEDQADLFEVLLNLSALLHTGTSAQQPIDFAAANLSMDAGEG